MIIKLALVQLFYSAYTNPALALIKKYMSGPVQKIGQGCFEPTPTNYKYKVLYT